MTVKPTAEGRFEIGDIGVLPDVSPIVTRVQAGDPADAPASRPGDVVVAVNGERVIFAERPGRRRSLAAAGMPIALDDPPRRHASSASP